MAQTVRLPLPRLFPAFASLIAFIVAVPCLNSDPLKEPISMLRTGFEDGLRGWRTQGDAEFALDTAMKHSGAQSARITIAPGTTLSYQQLKWELGPVNPGDEFRVSLWVRSRGVATDPGAYAALQFLDGAGARSGIVHSATSRTNGANDWQRLTMAGTAPKGTENATLDLILHAEGTAWFDDVEVDMTGRLEEWPDLGTQTREITIDTGEVVHPSFGGVGFHVFHHAYPASQEIMDTVIAKRWREIRPSFARMNDRYDWDKATWDDVAGHMRRMLDETGTEIYLTTWGPKKTAPGQERADYAKQVVDNLEYLVRDKGLSNVKTYCMTNELTLDGWGSMVRDMPTFKDYHQHLYDEIQRRGLDVGLLASDASPIEYWHTIEWAARNMDDITAIYGGHHYINDRPLDDERFYPWFLSKLQWGAGIARDKGKNFILGEFGCKQDGRIRDGKKWDACIYWDTPQEPLVAIQLSEAAIAAINAGVYAMGNWTYMDFPDEASTNYANKWGMFRRSGDDYSTRAHYYAYGLLTRFFRGPATVFATACNDPYLRVAAVRHHDAGSWSIAVVNRCPTRVPISLQVKGDQTSATLRKYVYDPANIPFHPFGDMQAPEGLVEMASGKLEDSVGPSTLTVYTSAFDAVRPAAVAGITASKQDDGAWRVEWQANAEEDFCYYRVYGSDEPAFELAVENQVGSTIATHFIDRRPEQAERRFYRVIAVDTSGNAGPG